MPIARAKKGRRPVEGEAVADNEGRIAERLRTDRHCAARRGFEVAATTDVENQSVRGGLTKEVNPPNRRLNGRRRRGIKAKRFGSRQCRLGPR